MGLPSGAYHGVPSLVCRGGILQREALSGRPCWTATGMQHMMKEQGSLSGLLMPPSGTELIRVLYQRHCLHAVAYSSQQCCP